MTSKREKRRKVICLNKDPHKWWWQFLYEFFFFIFLSNGDKPKLINGKWVPIYGPCSIEILSTTCLEFWMESNLDLQNPILYLLVFRAVKVNLDPMNFFARLDSSDDCLTQLNLNRPEIELLHLVGHSTRNLSFGSFHILYTRFDNSTYRKKAKL